MDDPKEGDPIPPKKEDPGSEFSWYQEIQKKEKEIEKLSLKGKEKSQEIKKLRSELDGLKGKNPADPTPPKKEADPTPPKKEADPAPPKTNKEKYYSWDPRYWMEDKEK